MNFADARRDPQLAVLEGFHAVKHALRFGAELTTVVGSDPAELERLAAALAPDLAGRFEELVEVVPPDDLPRTGVMAIARRPPVDAESLLADPGEQPIVLLEDPRHLPNLGACVRVAAAAGAAGVLTTGTSDPWHPDALRGAAGLHFAVPVARFEGLPASDRALIALDPDGDPFEPHAIPPRAVLAFGSERHGLSYSLRRLADERVALPMRPGVSSLNLSTSVAAVLYALRPTPLPLPE